MNLRTFVPRLWQRDPSLWSADASVQATIRDRLGWLDAATWTRGRLDELSRFAESVRRDGFQRVVLLGMGGSSLAPEVLNRVCGPQPGWPQFTMLDSTDPGAIRAVDRDLEHTLFVLASKSGSTIEPNCLAAYFASRLVRLGIDPAERRLIVITDPGSPLHQQSLERGVRQIFLNPPDIGGRFSALSLFGMVPAALMGVDIGAILTSGHEMADACRHDDLARNPGVSLGVRLGHGANEGRDKLSLTMPAAIESFGLWIEQLVAESTGKNGKGIVPIVNEGLATSPMSADRNPVSITLASPEAIGGEFMRWEIATATAGALLGVNPFDEPNVRQAKEATGALLDAYKKDGRLPTRRADTSDDVASLTLSEPARQVLGTSSAWTFLRMAARRDYVGLLNYLPASRAVDEVCRHARHFITEKTGCAVMAGYGPRYLHSTGQLHKGGPNTGVFVIVTADPVEDLDVPGAGFTFGVLERAQALGDFLTLEREGRRAVHAHLRAPDAETLRKLLDRLSESV